MTYTLPVTNRQQLSIIDSCSPKIPPFEKTRRVCCATNLRRREVQIFRSSPTLHRCAVGLARPFNAVFLSHCGELMGQISIVCCTYGGPLSIPHRVQPQASDFASSTPCRPHQIPACASIARPGAYMSLQLCATWLVRCSKSGM